MKTLLTVLLAAFFVAASQAQAPATPAATPIPAPTAASGAVTGAAFVVRTGTPSFFSAPNFNRAVRTNLTNVVTPAQTPGVPAVPTPAPAVPTAGQTAPVVPPQGPIAIPGPPTPGVAAGTAAGAVGPPGQTVISPAGATPARALTNEIPAGMLRFQEAELIPVLDYYADLVGRTIIRSPQVPPSVKLTINNKTPLTVQEGIDALNTLLALNNITMVEEGEKFIKAVPNTAVPQEAVQFSRETRENLPDSHKIVAQIVHLKYITPEDAIGLLTYFSKLQNSVLALKGTSILILRDYAENVKRMLEILEELDVAQPLDVEPVVIPIRYALAGDVASVLSGLSAGGSTVSFGAGSGMSGFGGGGGVGGFGGGVGGAGFGQQGRLGGGLGGQNYPGNVGGVNPGIGGTRTLGTTGLGGGGLGRSAFGNRLGQAVQRSIGAAGGGAGGGAGDIQLIGTAKIIADERSNALLIFADRQDLPMITNIISKLDVVLPQVLIEALIMEVNLGGGQSLGVSMSQNRQQSGKLTTAGASLNGGFLDPNNLLALGNFLSGSGTNGGGTAPSGFNYFGKYGQDFDFAVNAAANDSRINVLSRPRVQTSNAKTANIFVGEQRPFITGSYFSDFSGVGSRSQYQLQDIGISLSVTPIINQDGLVTMEIAQDISQVGGTTKIDNNDVPITITRTAQSYVSVHDRDTIILGGFISTTKNKSKSGVPYLKDIPGLGALFRSSSENIQRVELMVLIRPTVLPTPEAAALTAATERDKLPGIKRAERDEEEFASKQLEKERLEEEKNDRRKR